MCTWHRGGLRGAPRTELVGEEGDGAERGRQSRTTCTRDPPFAQLRCPWGREGWAVSCRPAREAAESEIQRRLPQSRAGPWVPVPTGCSASTTCFFSLNGRTSRRQEVAKSVSGACLWGRKTGSRTGDG